ncbi:MAG TPA: AAA family ATPase [Motilibacterales bacterium]|nr:AAA family ATPase [Motilibacterales bacterium]
MRLHLLRMHAVGPFADEQVIDFDRLGAGGLFLFEGPTGVGKSTILDALTFALYGGLASDSGDPARLRSDFAGPNDRPEVTLEFSVRGGRHRITRSPEYARPKRRGTGVTKEKACVHLERFVAGGWESRSHAKDEVGVIVGELLGLTREQFRQVVLLPQGEFATFLRAGDDERREVLGKLFGTQFFRTITESLQARAQQANRALLAADAELGARVAAACEAAGLGAEEGSELGVLQVEERLEGLVALDGQLARCDKAAGEAAERAEIDQGQARSVLADARSVAARLEQRAQLEAALAEAQEQRADHEARRDVLARARQAIPVRPLMELVDGAVERVAALRAAVAAARAGRAADPQHLEGAGWQELAGQAASNRTTAGELAHLVVIEDDLAADRGLLESQRATVLELTAASQGAQERGGQIPVELAQSRADLGAAQQAAVGVAASKAVLAAIAGQAEAAQRLTDLSRLIEQRRGARRAARRAHQEADDHHRLLVDQRLADVRGQLAARLVSGDPCLVCGSPEHPAPAWSVTAGVSEEQVRHAAALRDDSRLILDEAELALVRAEADRDHATRLAGGISAEQWQARIDETRAELASGELAQASLPGLEARVAQLGAEQAQLGADLIRLAEALAGAHAQEAHLVADLEMREAQVLAARAGCTSVRDRAVALVTSAAALESLSAAVLDLSRGLEHLASATARADVEASRSGFVDLTDARSAHLATPDLDELERAVNAWEAAVAAAWTQLDSAEMRAVADVDPERSAADVTLATAEVERLECVARAAHEEATVARRQRERFAERLAEVQECAAQRAERAAAGAELVSLDLYARGMAGSPRMSLVTFVLRYWFEQVVMAANVRLESMSAGKYELLRIDEAARKDARVGLGLAVLDRHTGRERSPGTLSGGETFYTSLALALGLADVVVAQAGGAQLDTLFIDEGFGSLDPDTLDDVMGVIDDLRGNGRVIGIVSHVPELKERIAERLTVRRLRPDGPSTVVVRA